MPIEKIIILEDDEIVRRHLEQQLRQRRYDVLAVGTLAAAQEALCKDTFDLFFLDVRLPDGEGTNLLRELQGRPQKPLVVISTGFGSVESAVECMRHGAFDYLIKPFAFAELSARIRALLRRGAQETPRLRVADLEMDTAARQVRRSGQTIDLKMKEYALLEFLLRNAHRAVTRTMIVEHVWDIHFDSISNVVAAMPPSSG